MKRRVFPLAFILLFTPICFVAPQAPHSAKAALASASQQQDSAKKEVSEACPVTKPPAEPFVPPPPYWTDHGPDRFWYGTESWTLLCVRGTWKGGYGTKLTDWRRGFDWRKEPEPNLIVIAKRLDREAPTVAAYPAHAVFVTTERPGMMTGIEIPSMGCWEVTAQYGGNRLSFVVSVQP